MQRFLLFVENDPVQREILDFAAKRAGLDAASYCVLGDANEACSYLRQAEASVFVPPSAIITDLKLPRMDGIDLLAWIRENPTFKKTPVIILGIAFREGDRERAEALGCDDFKAKPSEISDWLDLIKRFYLWTTPPPKAK